MRKHLSGKRKIHRKDGRETVLLLEPVSFSGIARDLKECTLKTAQPDGKHLVKKPVAKR